MVRIPFVHGCTLYMGAKRTNMNLTMMSKREGCSLYVNAERSLMTSDMNTIGMQKKRGAKVILIQGMNVLFLGNNFLME